MGRGSTVSQTGIMAPLLLYLLSLCAAGFAWQLNPENGIYYQYYPDTQLDFNSAKDFCKEREAKLATPRNSRDQAYLTNLAPMSFWLGITDQADEGQWTYLDGNPLQWTNWKSGHSPRSGDYAVCMNGVWEEVSATAKCKAVVCERDTLLY